MFNYKTETHEILLRQNVARSVRSVFMWQAAGMGLCVVTGLSIANSAAAWNFIAQRSYIMMLSMFASFLVSLYTSRKAFDQESSYSLLVGSYAAYWVLDGVFLAYIFRLFTPASILLSFGIALGLFTTMALYGYFTNADLNSFGSLLTTSMVGIIIASLANLYFQSSLTSYLIAYVGILTFTGLVGYYTQKIKLIIASVADNEAMTKRVIIFGALYLGITLMQIFLYVLRFFGRRD